MDQTNQTDLSTALTILLDGENKLKPNERAIARDLLLKRIRYNGWTYKQAEFADALFRRGIGETKPRQKVEVGNFEGVYKLFDTASKKLKYPKIQLRAGTYPVTIYRAGAKSKFPGTIQVTDGRGFHDGKWYGRVDGDGKWTKGRDTPELPLVEGLLKKLAENPEETAREFGKMTGRCCFCGHKLEDEQSVKAGYGPVCAVNYGLKAEYKAAA